MRNLASAKAGSNKSLSERTHIAAQRKQVGFDQPISTPISEGSSRKRTPLLRREPEKQDPFRNLDPWKAVAVPRETVGVRRPVGVRVKLSSIRWSDPAKPAAKLIVVQMSKYGAFSFILLSVCNTAPRKPWLGAGSPRCFLSNRVEKRTTAAAFNFL